MLTKGTVSVPVCTGGTRHAHQQRSHWPPASDILRRVDSLAQQSGEANYSWPPTIQWRSMLLIGKICFWNKNHISIFIFKFRQGFFFFFPIFPSHG